MITANLRVLYIVFNFFPYTDLDNSTSIRDTGYKRLPYPSAYYGSRNHGFYFLNLEKVY